MSNTAAEERPRVVLVCRCLVINENGQILLVRRAKDDGHDPGLWEVPGGKLDEGQDLEEALKREVIEETGLEIEIISPLAFTQSRVMQEGKYAGLPYVRLFYIGKSMSGELTLSNEHSEAVWIKLSQLEDYVVRGDVTKAVTALRQQLTALGVQ